MGSPVDTKSSGSPGPRPVVIPLEIEPGATDTHRCERGR